MPAVRLRQNSRLGNGTVQIRPVRTSDRPFIFTTPPASPILCRLLIRLVAIQSVARSLMLTCQSSMR
ncbi:hypothetical protein BRADI_3g49255v3 [Brachypodium distachyon]|uniref:Uncharacterized protein n=1 Tax=Brachypodium distachyon TaxID=15368 RepID=A0A0Q3FQP0_BRADI|nr:hypothetical protein BRADI_3g49255v3 [Brachypodium distachyon]